MEAVPLNRKRTTAREILFVAWTVIFTFSACAASKVNYTVLDQGIHSGKSFPSLHFEIITEKAAFEKLSAAIHSDKIPAPNRPEVDFRKALVVFVSLGEKPSAGYRVSVNKVTRDEKTVRVKIKTEAPRADEFQATVITQPYVLIKIKKEPGIEKIALVDNEDQVIAERSIPGNAGAN
jgi:hypothetical protein